jgi:Trypsin-co-occurring domain 1
MTLRVVRVELEPGGPVVLAEVDGEEPDEAHGRAASPREVLESGSRSVREAIDTLVVPSARLFVEGLRQVKPSTVEVEFGLKLSGQAGLLFASSSTEGTITVRLAWEFDEKSGAGRGNQ